MDETRRNKGTPKTIPEFIRRELICGPLSSVEYRLIYGFKDYLAQGFGAAILMSPEAEKILIDLFDKLTKGIE